MTLTHELAQNFFLRFDKFGSKGNSCKAVLYRGPLSLTLILVTWGPQAIMFIKI